MTEIPFLGLGKARIDELTRKADATSLPAQKVGLKDRGLLREGMRADIVIIDLEKIDDVATCQDPKRFPKGLQYVIVNGKITVKNGAFTGKNPGEVLRKTG